MIHDTVERVRLENGRVQVAAGHGVGPKQNVECVPGHERERYEEPEERERGRSVGPFLGSGGWGRGVWIGSHVRACGDHCPRGNLECRYWIN